MAIKATGFDGKFSTDLMRTRVLKVTVKSGSLQLPFTAFGGYPVIVVHGGGDADALALTSNAC